MVITTTFREGARRVIGATAKPLYAIDGKAEGLDRRTLQTSLLEGGGPPAGGGRSERRSAGLRGLGGLKPCARSAGKSMAEIGNRKERLRDYASFPEDFDLPRSKVATGLLPFAWDAPPR